MERTTKINELEGLDSPVDPNERDDPRLIGEVVAEIVISLGNDQAMMPNNFVRITPAVRSGHGQPGRSVATQSIRGARLIPNRHGQARSFAW